RLYAELGQGMFGLAACCARRGDVELLAQAPAAAVHALQRQREALEAMGDRANLATCAAGLGEAMFEDDRYEEAEHWARTAEALASSDDVPTQFLWRSVRAKLLARAGDAAAAEALAREAVALADTTDSLNQRATAKLDLARVLRTCGRDELAAE